MAPPCRFPSDGSGSFFCEGLGCTVEASEIFSQLWELMSFSCSSMQVFRERIRLMYGDFTTECFTARDRNDAAPAFNAERGTSRHAQKDHANPATEGPVTTPPVVSRSGLEGDQVVETIPKRFSYF